MGVLGKLLGIAKTGGQLLDKTTVDKDTLIQAKTKFKEMEHLVSMAAHEDYRKELEAPLNFRTVQRPLWSFICVHMFALECLSFIVSYAFKMIPGMTFVMEPLVFPLPINGIIMTVVMFYFGGRMFDKQNTSRFSQKWGI